MRILHLHEDLSFGGGAELYLKALLTHQKALGYRVKVLETTRVPPTRVLAAARKADIVHLHVVYYHTSLTLLFPLVFLFSTVLTMHDVLNFCPRLDMTPPDEGLCLSPAGLHCLSRCRLSLSEADLLRHTLKRALLRRIGLILCPSRFVVKLLRYQGFSRKRLRHLPLFLPFPEELKGTHRGRLAPPLKILFVGRKSRPKGFDVFLEALKRLSRPFYALAVGSGKTGLLFFSQGFLRLCPSVPRWALSRFYLWADVLVFPSLAPESFGFVPLEAAYLGCVPLATYPGGPEDWLKEELLFERGNPSTLATKLEFFSFYPARLEILSKEVQNRVKPFIDPSPHLRALEYLYRALCG